jgi:hypothetical protein
VDVINAVQSHLDLCNTPRIRLNDVRASARQLETFVTTHQRRVRVSGLMSIDEFVRAKIEKYKPTFLGGRG